MQIRADHLATYFSHSVASMRSSSKSTQDRNRREKSETKEKSTCNNGPICFFGVCCSSRFPLFIHSRKEIGCLQKNQVDYYSYKGSH
ncbi:hypothetical protein SDJN02_26734, partial [Cucurbita argyrosperma subsp. argyrosperma]